jgi:hypothetical protein
MRNSSDSPNKPPVDHTGSYDYAEDKENRTLGAANIPSALASEVPRTELQVKPASYSYPKPGNNIPAKLLHLLNPIIETTEEASMGWAAINGHEQDLFGSDGLSEPEEWQLDDDSSLLGGSDSDLSSWSNVDNGSLFSDDDEGGRRKRRKRGRPPLSSETVGKVISIPARYLLL